ncbi:MAG: alpha-glucoside transport system substrate-binding protein [Chloroflexota bacterium]|nr:alpha-glucoside transport system substrate-binding protein [Chloroflexota bacterium]
MKIAKLLLLIPLVLVAACSPGQGSSSSKGTVHVLGTWGGSEQDSFLAMVKPFEDRTGIKVSYEGTRDINAVLTTRVQAGNPPELAGLPGPGQMFQFAKDNKLIALDGVLDQAQMSSQYPPSWIKLGQYNSKTYAIFIKTSLKGLLWYDPKNFAAKNYTPPTTWDELTALQAKIAATGTTPWCLAVESGSASGWPGSDFIKEIVLSQSGQAVYDSWWNGKQKWTSPEIKLAWQTFGKIIANGQVYGGKQQVLATNFGDVGQPIFQAPPKCYMVNQASFITDFFSKYSTAPKAGTDYTFTPLPDVNPANAGAHVVAGDLFGMFKDTDQARQLLKYLTTAEAQTIWVKRGGAISPNKDVKLADYPDDLSRSIGKVMTEAKVAEFDAGDLMPNAMQADFWKGVLDYINDPGQLDSILARLDKTQADAYK